MNVNVEPAPTWLFTHIHPPCNSTNFRHSVNPSPVPSTFTTKEEAIEQAKEGRASVPALKEATRSWPWPTGTYIPTRCLTEASQEGQGQRDDQRGPMSASPWNCAAAASTTPAMAGPMIRGSRFCIDCSANAIP